MLINGNTDDKSLSPLPHIFIIIIWSFLWAASLPVICNAWAGSNAGIIPSNLLHNSKAAKLSSSVVERYLILPKSCNQECSGPIPG